MVDEMPADPFKGEADWGPLASGCAGLFGALVAAGLSEGVALELAKTYLQSMLGIMLAGAAQQQEEGMEGGPACRASGCCQQAGGRRRGVEKQGAAAALPR